LKRALLLALIVVSAYAAGFYFDRWLHRPIVIIEHYAQYAPETQT
jgi:hypothetical protein